MAKDIAILGSDSESLAVTPWDRPGTEFWASASFRLDHPELVDRVDCWFALQPNAEWLSWAIETQPRCFLRDRHDEIEQSRSYPIEIIAERFGSYFTSSVAYMLALAVEYDGDWIGLYGVDMEIPGKYLHQRACCEYLIGMARGTGIEVEIPEESPLLRVRRMYAYESEHVQDQDWCFVPDVIGFAKRQANG